MAYFMHRIQYENNRYQKGIEVHDTLDSAILSFWGRMKTGYNNPDHSTLTFIHCKITDESGNAVRPYDMSWQKEVMEEPQYFLHHIRKDGENYTKDIDICESFDTARSAYAAAMEYGYNNPKFPNVSFVSCEITDNFGSVVDPFSDTWVKPEEEPEQNQNEEGEE